WPRGCSPDDADQPALTQGTVVKSSGNACCDDGGKNTAFHKDSRCFAEGFPCPFNISFLTLLPAIPGKFPILWPGASNMPTSRFSPGHGMAFGRSPPRTPTDSSGSS